MAAHVRSVVASLALLLMGSLACARGIALADGEQAGPDDGLWPDALRNLHGAYLAEQRARQDAVSQKTEGKLDALRRQIADLRAQVLEELKVGTTVKVVELRDVAAGAFGEPRQVPDPASPGARPVAVTRQQRVRLLVSPPPAYGRLLRAEVRGGAGKPLNSVKDAPDAWDVVLPSDGDHAYVVRHFLASWESLPQLGVEWETNVRVRLDSAAPPVSFIGMVGGALVRKSEDATVVVRSEPGAEVWWEHTGRSSAVKADAGGMALLPAVPAGEYRVQAADWLDNTHATPPSVRVRVDKEAPVIRSLKIFQQGAQGWQAHVFVSDDIEARGTLDSGYSRVEVDLQPLVRQASIDLVKPSGNLVLKDAVGRQADVPFQAPPAVAQVGVATLRVEPMPGLPEARLEVIGGLGGEVTGDAAKGWMIDLSSARKDARKARLSGKLRGQIDVEWELNLFIDDREPTIEEVSPAAGSLLEQVPARVQVKVGPEVVTVRFMLGEHVITGSPTGGVVSLDLSTLPKGALLEGGASLEALDRLGRSARLQLDWVISTLPAAAKDAVPWPDDDRPRVDLRGKKKEQWFRIQIDEAGSYAFEANARRAGQAMKVRLEIWETGPTGRMLDANDGREGRWKGDPRINAMLNEGVYLIRAKAISGQGWFQIAREMQR